MEMCFTQLRQAEIQNGSGLYEMGGTGGYLGRAF